MMNVVKYCRGYLVNRKLQTINRSIQATQAEEISKHAGLKKYDSLMRAKREELYQRVHHLYAQVDSEQLTELFLIYFSAIGAKMVEPAPVWLNQWGRGFKKIGFEKLGSDLIAHAHDEEGHHIWHQNDVRFLVSHFNQKYGAGLDVPSILQEGAVACVQHYTDAFDYARKPGNEHSAIGMLYETELMTFTLGPQFIGFCVQELGFGILKGLSFLRGHMASDIGHVKENIEQLKELLNGLPREDAMEQMIEMGQKTVDVYIEYFETAMQLAKVKLHSIYRQSA